MHYFIFLLLSLISFTSAAGNLEHSVQIASTQKQLPQKTMLATPSLKTQHGFSSGSLRENITHLAQQFGWSTVVWRPPYDYQWVGKTYFSENNLKDILQNVLRHFPLQAIFYQGNHVLVITSRNPS